MSTLTGNSQEVKGKPAAVKFLRTGIDYAEGFIRPCGSSYTGNNTLKEIPDKHDRD